MALNAPERKTRTVEKGYWSCGLDTEGHFHTTESGASACIKKQKRNRKPTHRWNPAMLDALAVAVDKGGTAKELAAEYNVGVAHMKTLIQRAMFRRRWRQEQAARLPE